jgi:hypothetical protein
LDDWSEGLTMKTKTTTMRTKMTMKTENAVVSWLCPWHP